MAFVQICVLIAGGAAFSANKFVRSVIASGDRIDIHCLVFSSVFWMRRKRCSLDFVAALLRTWVLFALGRCSQRLTRTYLEICKFARRRAFFFNSMVVSNHLHYWLLLKSIFLSFSVLPIAGTRGTVWVVRIKSPQAFRLAWFPLLLFYPRMRGWFAVSLLCSSAEVDIVVLLNNATLYVDVRLKLLFCLHLLKQLFHL